MHFENIKTKETNPFRSEEQNIYNSFLVFAYTGLPLII